MMLSSCLYKTPFDNSYPIPMLNWVISFHFFKWLIVSLQLAMGKLQEFGKNLHQIVKKSADIMMLQD